MSFFNVLVKVRCGGASVEDMAILAAINRRKINISNYICNALGLTPPNIDSFGISFTIPININGYPKVSKISISLITIMESNNLNNKRIETALIDDSGALIYIDEIGYQDVVVHRNEDVLLNDIRNLIEGIPPAGYGPETDS